MIVAHRDEYAATKAVRIVGSHGKLPTIEWSSVGLTGSIAVISLALCGMRGYNNKDVTVRIWAHLSK